MTFVPFDSSHDFAAETRAGAHFPLELDAALLEAQKDHQYSGLISAFPKDASRRSRQLPCPAFRRAGEKLENRCSAESISPKPRQDPAITTCLTPVNPRNCDSLPNPTIRKLIG